MNRLKVLLLALVVLCCAVSQRWAKADTFNAAELYPSGAVHAKVLPNGVHTLVRTTPGSGVVSLQVWVEAGSRFETAANNGATHLIEMLAMQGSRDYPTETDGNLSGPQTRLENLGGDVNSFTARDDVFWSVTLAPSGLGEAAKIMANAVLHPNLGDEDVAAAKTMAAGEWMAHRMDPVAYSSDLAYKTAYRTQPYGKPVQGDINTLKQLSGHAVREYYNQRFTGSHFHVVVVGDVDVAAAANILAEAFAQAPKTATPDAAVPAQSPWQGKRQVTERGALPIEVLTFAWPSPGITSPQDTVATDLLLTYLNEGTGAALRQKLQDGADEESSDDDENESSQKEPAGLAGGFSVDYLTQRDTGLFLITIIAPIKKDEAVAAVMELMEGAKGGLPEAGLQYAKTMLRRQYVEQAETSTGQAGGLGFYDAIDSYEFAVNYLKLVDQTTNADIARVAQKYFGSENYVQVTLLPSLNNAPPTEGGGIIASLQNQNVKVY